MCVLLRGGVRARVKNYYGCISINIFLRYWGIAFFRYWVAIQLTGIIAFATTGPKFPLITGPLLVSTTGTRLSSNYNNNPMYGPPPAANIRPALKIGAQ